MFSEKVFSLTDEEYKEIYEWAKTHKCKARLPGGRASRSCCGGEISMRFTPTSFGTFKEAQCICGEKLEIDNV